MSDAYINRKKLLTDLHVVEIGVVDKLCTQGNLEAVEPIKTMFKNIYGIVLAQKATNGINVARWEINPDGYYVYCTGCGKEPRSGTTTDYCPNCGAAMFLDNEVIS